MNDLRCNGCAAKHKCSTAVAYGSVICTRNRLNSGQTKSELDSVRKQESLRYCPHCGKKIDEEIKTPESLLFTRHQLAALANT